MSTLLLISIVIVLISVLLLGINVFFTKTRRFPSSHVGAQPALREKGLSCHREQHADDSEKRNLEERIKEEDNDDQIN